MSILGFGFGNYSSYVAVVRTGGIDTLDNDYSYRATPTYISFTQLMRFCGNASKSQLVTNFRNTFSSFKNLIGLLYDDPVAQTEMNSLSSTFIKLQDGTIGVECNYLGEVVRFSIPQLVAIMLTQLKNTALLHTPKANECVLSVPCFFTDAQRRFVLESCHISDIRPLTLINDTAAVCYNYALFKTDLPADDQPGRVVMFIDIGYSCTQICVASFKKSSVSIVSSYGTNEIGGRLFDKVICERFCDDFLNKYKIDLRQHKKAYLKLLNEAESAKKQMNTTAVELPIKIECLYEEFDFVTKISREQFDDLSSNIYQKLGEIITKVHEDCKKQFYEISAIETVGGSSRILGVKSLIKSIMNMDPCTTLNADEAVSRGCAIQCALLSPGIRLKNIDLKDQTSSQYVLRYVNKNNESKQMLLLKEWTSIPRVQSITFPATQDHTFEVVEITLMGAQTIIAQCRSFGKNPIECNAKDLVYTIKFDLSNIMSITKVAFVENKTVTETPENSETPETSSPQSTSKITKVYHPLEFECHYFLTFADKMAEYVLIEKEMQNKIEEERARSSAKNALEEYVYSMREKITSVYAEFTTPEETETLLAFLTSQEDWLYGDGDYVSVEEYEKHHSDTKLSFSPVQSRFEGFNKSFQALDLMSLSLVKYRKFIDIASADPSKYDFLPKDEVEAYFQKVLSCDSFVIQSYNALKNQPKTKLPSVVELDINTRHSELVSICEKLIKKSESPPEKPTPPTEEPCQEKKGEENGIEHQSPKIQEQNNPLSGQV